MNIRRVKAGLLQLKRSFRRILEDGAGDVIDWAIAELENSKVEFEARKKWTHDPRLIPQPWGYRIHPDRPLRFKSSASIRGLEPQVDLYCTVLWEEEGALPVQQEIHLRVWSENSDYIYRDEWDAQEVCDSLTDPSRQFEGRVMLRCHFDLANPKQQGPKYHLQFGGKAEEYELWWFPKVVDLPRLVYPPMDLILACQLVAANFFWEEYTEFRETPEWMGTLLFSQKHLLQDYYEGCFKTINEKRPLLDYLWNV